MLLLSPSMTGHTITRGFSMHTSTTSTYTALFSPGRMLLCLPPTTKPIDLMSTRTCVEVVYVEQRATFIPNLDLQTLDGTVCLVEDLLFFNANVEEIYSEFNVVNSYVLLVDGTVGIEHLQRIAPLTLRCWYRGFSSTSDSVAAASSSVAEHSRNHSIQLVVEVKA